MLTSRIVLEYNKRKIVENKHNTRMGRGKNSIVTLSANTAMLTNRTNEGKKARNSKTAWCDQPLLKGWRLTWKR